MKTLIALCLVFAGCRVTQEQKLDGEATARVVVEFPQTQACFDDKRIETYEQLKECLELVTNNKWTVTAEGEVIEAIDGLVPEDEAIDQPTNIEGAS